MFCSPHREKLPNSCRWHYGENQRDGISEQPWCDISVTVYWANVLPPDRLRTASLFYCKYQNHLKQENIFQFICLFIYFWGAVSIICFVSPPSVIHQNMHKKQWKLRHSVCSYALRLIGVTFNLEELIRALASCMSTSPLLYIITCAQYGRSWAWPERILWLLLEDLPLRSV